MAISQDMYAIDIQQDFPNKWRSSLAVYVNQPDPDPTDTSGETSLFLKVVASITGYNYDRVVFPGGGGTKGPPAGSRGSDYVVHFEEDYYPAYCAVAQIAVYPNSGEWSVNDYPYFSDFQPKQREVIET